MDVHHRFMRQALVLAKQAYDEGEIPVGALIVDNGRVIGKGYNQTERLKDPTAHAEILAISAACQTLDNKYLPNCTLYVTLEPCPMCATALVWSKIGRIVFAAHDDKYGACGSHFNLHQHPALNHKIEVLEGVMAQESEQMIKDFFALRRR